MKPSEKIKEVIYEETGGTIANSMVPIWALIKYLDKVYEEEQKALNKDIQ